MMDSREQASSFLQLRRLMKTRSDTCMSSLLCASKIVSGGYNVLEYSKPGDALGFLSKDHIRLIALYTIIFHRKSIKRKHKRTHELQAKGENICRLPKFFTINITTTYLKTKGIPNSKLGNLCCATI
jgi:hypothetical protein